MTGLMSLTAFRDLVMGVMMIDVIDVAEFFIQSSYGEDGAKGISKLELDRLMYFSQLAYMRRYGEPLFSDDFHASGDGAVLPSLECGMGYSNGNASDGIHSDLENASVDDIPDDAYALLSFVYMTFRFGDDGRLMGSDYIRKGPWMDVRRANPDDDNAVIPKSGMLDYARSTPILTCDHILDAWDDVHDERGVNGHHLLPAEYEDDSIGFEVAPASAVPSSWDE